MRIFVSSQSVLSLADLAKSPASEEETFHDPPEQAHPHKLPSFVIDSAPQDPDLFDDEEEGSSYFAEPAQQPIANESVQLAVISTSTSLPTLDKPIPLNVPGLLQDADLGDLPQDLPELVSAEELGQRQLAEQSKGLTEKLPELNGFLTEQEATSALSPKRPSQVRLLH